MDQAVERRFLYKIDFEKPTSQARKQIWQNMFPALKEAEAGRLAASFEFSGGQIENVARKAAIKKVLQRRDANLDEILELCSEEKNDNAEHHIGFAV
jgi:SpoVK/Ycf46/Vps4 family AAA+-type ATPase